MKWNKYTIETTAQAEEIVTYTLSELGITNVEIEDKKPLSEADKKRMFVDILPEIEDDGEAYVSFYLEITDEESSFDEIIDNVKKELNEMAEFTDMGSLNIMQSVTEDEDWINNWKAYFKPFYIDDILIKPTWEEIPEEKNYSMYIDIDPGIAFGTGMHETTRLCIRQLRKYVNSDINLLDVGCGSGILSIIGLKLGAGKATAIDIDPDATKATHENAEVNGIDMSTYTVFDGNILDDKEIQDKTGYECYDIVVANILADVIIPLQKIIAPHMKKGAIFITSGIINTKEEEVKKAIEANDALEIKEITRDGDWVSITAFKTEREVNMHHFFVTPECVNDENIIINGSDVNHIKNVLRMKQGEELLVSDGQGKDYLCEISEIDSEQVIARIIDGEYGGTELKTKFYLFQGMPKSDKMELIIQKAVELGCFEIIPVQTKRSIVKLDKKKEESKIKRWNAISESAAKQSRRSIVPEVKPVMSFKEAISYAKDFDVNLIPYENFKGMQETVEAVSKIKSDQRVGIFIGPEGGFEESEVDLAVDNDVLRISLGKRILRTETAGMTILSVLMFKLEGEQD